MAEGSDQIVSVKIQAVLDTLRSQLKEADSMVSAFKKKAADPLSLKVKTEIDSKAVDDFERSLESPKTLNVVVKYDTSALKDVLRQQFLIPQRDQQNARGYLPGIPNYYTANASQSQPVGAQHWRDASTGRFAKAPETGQWGRIPGAVGSVATGSQPVQSIGHSAIPWAAIAAHGIASHKHSDVLPSSVSITPKGTITHRYTTVHEKPVHHWYNNFTTARVALGAAEGALAGAGVNLVKKGVAVAAPYFTASNIAAATSAVVGAVGASPIATGAIVGASIPLAINRFNKFSKSQDAFYRLHNVQDYTKAISGTVSSIISAPLTIPMRFATGFGQGYNLGLDTKTKDGGASFAYEHRIRKFEQSNAFEKTAMLAGAFAGAPFGIVRKAFGVIKPAIKWSVKKAQEAMDVGIPAVNPITGKTHDNDMGSIINGEEKTEKDKYPRAASSKQFNSLMKVLRGTKDEAGRRYEGGILPELENTNIHNQELHQALFGNSKKTGIIDHIGKIATESGHIHAHAANISQTVTKGAAGLPSTIHVIVDGKFPLPVKIDNGGSNKPDDKRTPDTPQRKTLEDALKEQGRNKLQAKFDLSGTQEVAKKLIIPLPEHAKAHYEAADPKTAPIIPKMQSKDMSLHNDTVNSILSDKVNLPIADKELHNKVMQNIENEFVPSPLGTGITSLPFKMPVAPSVPFKTDSMGAAKERDLLGDTWLKDQYAPVGPLQPLKSNITISPDKKFTTEVIAEQNVKGKLELQKRLLAQVATGTDVDMEPRNRFMIHAAVQPEGSKHVVYNDQGEISAIAAVGSFPDKKRDYVSYLASSGKDAGAGIAAMQSVFKSAAKKDHTVDLSSTKDARQFYKKIGMQADTRYKSEFSISPAEIKNQLNTFDKFGNPNNIEKMGMYTARSEKANILGYRKREGSVDPRVLLAMGTFGLSEAVMAASGTIQEARTISKISQPAEQAGLKDVVRETIGAFKATGSNIKNSLGKVFSYFTPKETKPADSYAAVENQLHKMIKSPIVEAKVDAVKSSTKIQTGTGFPQITKLGEKTDSVNPVLNRFSEALNNATQHLDRLSQTQIPEAKNTAGKNGGPGNGSSGSGGSGDSGNNESQKQAKVSRRPLSSLLGMIGKMDTGAAAVGGIGLMAAQRAISLGYEAQKDSFDRKQSSKYGTLQEEIGLNISQSEKYLDKSQFDVTNPLTWLNPVADVATGLKNAWDTGEYKTNRDKAFDVIDSGHSNLYNMKMQDAKLEQVKQRSDLKAQIKINQLVSDPIAGQEAEIHQRANDRAFANIQQVAQMRRDKDPDADTVKKQLSDANLAMEDSDLLKMHAQYRDNATLAGMSSQGNIISAGHIMVGDQAGAIKASASQQIEIIANREKSSARKYDTTSTGPDGKLTSSALAGQKAVQLEKDEVVANEAMQLYNREFAETQTTLGLQGQSKMYALEGAGQYTEAARLQIKEEGRTRLANIKHEYGEFKPQLGLFAKLAGALTGTPLLTDEHTEQFQSALDANKAQAAGFEENKKFVDKQQQFGLRQNTRAAMLEADHMGYAAQGLETASSGAAAIIANRDTDKAADINRKQIAENTRAKLLSQNVKLKEMNQFGTAQEIGKNVSFEALRDRDPDHDTKKISDTIKANDKMADLMDKFQHGKITKDQLEDQVGKMNPSGKLQANAGDGDDGDPTTAASAAVATALGNIYTLLQKVLNP